MDERSKIITELFQASWVEVEQRYADLLKRDGWEKVGPLLNFIIRFRASGRDRFFRAGTSLSTLLLSRSVAHGLRDDQKFISIEVLNVNDYEVKLRESSKTYREYQIKDLSDPALSKLLAALQATLVD